jgi:hypothetical protein
MVPSRIRQKLFSPTAYIVVSYRLLSLLLRRILFYFPHSSLFLFSYNSSRKPPFSPNLLDTLYQPPEELERLSENILNDNIIELFGHHRVRTSLLSNHIYEYPSSASFLSHSYPHFSQSYVQLHNSSDVKYTWEYGRLQWLIPVAYSHFHNPSSHKLSFILNNIDSFFGSAICSHGIHWSCTMDVSFRAISILSIYSYIEASLGNIQKILIQKVLYQHYLFILSNVELSFVNGNHLNSNLAALVHLSFFFNNIYFSPPLQIFFKHFASSELQKQFDETGYNYEGSFPYARLNADLFFWIFQPYLISNASLPTKTLNRFFSIYNLLNLITDNCTLDPPLIGDNDSASIFVPKSNSLSDYIQSLAAIRLLLQTSTSISRTSSISPAATTFPYSGSLLEIPSPISNNKHFYYININGFATLSTSRINLFFFNTQPGLLGSGGHTHSDYLSLILYIDKYPFFVDPGTCTYSGDPSERDSYRAESYHNSPIRTRVLDEFSFSESLWSIKSNVSSSTIRVSRSDVSTTVSSSISRSNSSVQRSITLADGLITVTDYSCNCNILGSRFFLHPDVRIRTISFHSVSLHSDASPSSRIHLSIDPLFGCLYSRLYYYSPAYGARIPSYVIILEYYKPFSNTDVSLTISY